MATERARTGPDEGSSAEPTTSPFDRLGGIAAIAAAVTAVVYSIVFVALRASTLAPFLTSLGLIVGGLLSAVALVAVYERVRALEPSFALLGLLFGFAGTLGAAIHGGFDLANTLHPPSIGLGTLPSEIDPRGMLTFLASGIGVASLTWAAHRAAEFPRRLVLLGYLLAVLLVLIYLGRLIVLDPSSVLLLVPAGLAGVIVSPLWYGWIGYLLLTGRAQTPSLTAAGA